MWVFGYGSLMWDDWEKNFGGIKHAGAILHGYSRAFNKKSVRNWGTSTTPGPTLGLEVGEDMKCIGSAFEFPREISEEVLKYLKKREGNSFTLENLPIELSDGRRVEAYTPVNDTKRHTYIKDIDPKELAKMIKLAKGTSGKCLDYVANIMIKFSELGIEDYAVEEVWKSILDEDPA